MPPVAVMPNCQSIHHAPRRHCHDLASAANHLQTIMLHLQSPFADKLKTNYVPSDEEIEEIHALLVEPLDQLARFDTQIDELQAVLDQLKANRRSLKEEIDDHRALSSPMRRLPRDVLQEIFISCLPTKHNAVVHPREAPMLLGRVCSYWRNVAHTTPRIWSSIHVLSPPTETPPDIVSAFQDLVEAWLERSGSCPLSISFLEVWNSAKTSIILPHLLKVSHRIQHLELSAQILPKELRLLSLHRVSLHVNADALALPLPWSRLTDLTLSCREIWKDDGYWGGLDQNGVVELLRKSPNLMRCHLEVTAHAQFIASPTVTLPFCQEFILTCSVFGLIQSVKLMGCLIIPKLCYLRIGYPFLLDSPRAAGEGLSADLSLKLLSQPVLLEILRLFPQISRLHVDPPDFDYGTFLPALTPMPAQPLISPALRHITLVGVSESAGAYITPFVRGRMTSGCPIQSLDLEFDWPIEVDLLAELQEFIQEGLQVKLTFPPIPRWTYNAWEGLSV
ncbi:hypothetical protein C8R44DRAFT_772366 [Mycena epipterygia]|nr:hypothetical protein C8R44DRAFT_772366 [Mycena epipterygia]